MPTVPDLSVLTPSRNRRATFLPLAIASVRAARLRCTYEHVVVDDGSTDGTGKFLQGEAERDAHLRWQAHSHQLGVAAARNTALALARGRFVVDLDDDDLVTVEGLQHRYDYLLQHPAEWAVHANALKIDAQGRYLIGEDVVNFACRDPDRCAELFLTSSMIPNASTAMYRREALVALGGWDASLSCCEDYDLWLRSLGRYGPPGFLDEVVALYRRTRSQTASITGSEHQLKTPCCRGHLASVPSRFMPIAVRQDMTLPLLLRGQLAGDADGHLLYPGDMAAQIRQTLDNLETVLKAAGMTLANVVRLNYFTTDVDGFVAAAEVLGERLAAGNCRPASTLLGITRLFYPDQVVEFEATAVE